MPDINEDYEEKERSREAVARMAGTLMVWGMVICIVALAVKGCICTIAH